MGVHYLPNAGTLTGITASGQGRPVKQLRGGSMLLKTSRSETLLLELVYRLYPGRMYRHTQDGTGRVIYALNMEITIHPPYSPDFVPSVYNHFKILQYA